MISGKTLIAWGYKPGRWFAAAIAAAEQARACGADEAAIRAVDRPVCASPRAAAIALRRPASSRYRLNIRSKRPTTQKISQRSSGTCAN